MAGFARKPGGTSLVQDSAAERGGPVDPGKQTLTEQLPAAGAPGAPARPEARPADEILKLLDSHATAASAAQAFGILKRLDAAEQTAAITQIGASPRSRLATHLTHAAVSGEAEHAAVRHCFDATPDGELATLAHWVALRFDLKVTSTADSSGAPWDKVGLRRCWDVLEVLPAAHVENNADLKSLTRYRSDYIEGYASDSGEAAIGYGPKNHPDTDLEVGAFTDAKDPLRGKNIF
ncbi:MAG TPA: hypothetical protein VFT22_07005, partial [Kofleriaceae bacterium]|nr:hypothetical protein [Kofleriaceae bacterium]